MPLLVSLAALHKGVVRLTGEMTPKELGLETMDPCIAAQRPLRYDLSVELLGREVLASGRIETILDCRCVRCLEPFGFDLVLDPWTCALPLDGDEAIPIVNESVDLTPQLREDTLLGLPQHPVCRTSCRGLSLPHPDSSKPEGSSDERRRVPSAWSILDTLKLDR